MIAAATLGVGLIFLLAAVVRALDARRAATWREVAADRRQSWEARQGPLPESDVDAELDGEAYRMALLTAGR